MSKFKWALNENKLARVIGKLGNSATEAELLDAYKEIGGKVDLSEVKETKTMNDEETTLPAEKVADDVEVTADETVDTQEEVDEETL